MLSWDLDRARREMKKRDMDALIAIGHENSYYTSGFCRNMSRAYAVGGRPVITVTSADPSEEPVGICALYEKLVMETLPGILIKDWRVYPAWQEIISGDDVEAGTIRSLPKLVQSQREDLYNLLADVLREKGLSESSIGIDMRHCNKADWEAIIAKNPKVNFVDGDQLFFYLRMFKSEDEIAALRTAAEYGVKGIKAMIEGKVEGRTVGELQLRYQTGAFQAVTPDDALYFMMGRRNIGAADFFKNRDRVGYKIAKGDILFIDCGVHYKNYTSDMARTFVVGKPSLTQKKIFNALKAGYDAMLSIIKPGTKFKEVFRTGQDTIRKSGLDWIDRGHYGHTVGIGPEGEQPPFIAPNVEQTLEPNMVICLEAPLYITGSNAVGGGGYSIEDMLLITLDGYEQLTKLERDLIEL